jgi:hypothetical protein
MKTVTILLVLLMVFGLFIMVPATASADQGGNIGNQVCKFFDDFGGTHDDCVSFFNSNDWAPDVCKAFNNFGFKNQGQCVSFLRSF